MNILLVSQCSKRALTETRRILDQFAERRGERTWQTPITQAGLDTLRRLLRKTARKNTAVACHWIRGKDHSELLWIVGDARQFNAEGATPTNTTARNVLRAQDENDWHSLHRIQQLTALAALLHDMGKACDAFQDRLKGAYQGKNLYRHEWVSVRLFQAFVTNGGASASAADTAWLQKLASCADVDDLAAWQALWMGETLLRDGLDSAAEQKLPFKTLPPLAQAVAWLILTHHRLPALPASATESSPKNPRHGRIITGIGAGDLAGGLHKIDANWNEPFPAHDGESVKPYWQFSHGLPFATSAWRKRVARAAQGLLKSMAAQATPDDALQDPYVLHLSRLALTLGDHHYSSLKDERLRVKGAPSFSLFANTDRNSGKRLQRLDEHLLGVESHASQIAHSLPGFAGQLAHLINHRGLKKRSQHDAFRWQDKAADLAASVRQRAAEHGAFIVNMASTGCGKTLGNARIMNALADPQKGLRCAFAIGLRTLTLQTGRSFQRDLGLGDDELAILVGGAASRELFAYYEELAEKSGSASRRQLLDESSHVVFEGNEQHPVLHHLGNDPGARKLLAAPLLACTVDHLMPATESLRGGHQIAPMLRLMSGGLVLDEPDDFDLADLPALTRLVHWAGLLGSRVLLSSATLPPALLEGMFIAYLAGRRHFQKNRGLRPTEAPRVCCLWIDEFNQGHADCDDAASFRAQHLPFAQQREGKLAAQTLRRRAQLLPLPADFGALDKQQRRSQFALLLRDAALRLHQQHHSADAHSGKRISFGLIRMANIGPLFDVARAFFQHGVAAQTDMHIHLCVYHSQFPLFVRSAIEHRLDTALNCRQEDAVFDLPEIRQRIDAHTAQDQLFIVLGSPVTEVGRDHDYDWAVVEPSSMRSLIQLAGRVLRHRMHKVPEHANLLICNSNLRHFERPGQPAFCKPGFESKAFPLAPHTLQHLLAHLLDAQQQMPVDARPRIVARPKAERHVHGSLVDLEHERMEQQMLPPASTPEPPVQPARMNRLQKQAAAKALTAAAPAPARLNASSFWQHEHASLSGALQQAQPFRHDPAQDVDVMLRPNEDGDGYQLHRVAEGEKKWQQPQPYTLVDANLNHRLADSAVHGPGIAPWGEVDFMQAMAQQADAMDMSLEKFAERFATASLPKSAQGWWWHPVLGFSKRD